jgi:hypothetical protein
MKKKDRKVRFIANIILGIFLFCFLYFILWIIFKEKMPMHSVIKKINDNYDFYASMFFSYLPIIVIVGIAVRFLLPNSKKRFLKLQASLPTSKIKSLAMGLVEVEGQLVMITPLISPVSNQECIGYYYTIEDISKDTDGDYKYTTIHSETKCNVFEIWDDTGTILIEPEELEFIMLETTNIHSNNSKRYKETLLLHGQNRLLVGYADVKNNIPYICKDINRKVFGVTSSAGISLWNKYYFLLESFLFTTFFIAIIIVLIILN